MITIIFPTCRPCLSDHVAHEPDCSLLEMTRNKAILMPEEVALQPEGYIRGNLKEA